MDIMAHQRELAVALQWHFPEIWYGQQCRFGDQFTVTERPFGMTVHYVTVLYLTSVRSNFPLLRCRRDQHFPRCRPGLTQRQPRTGNAAAPASAQVINLRIRWRLLDLHLLPVHA